MAAMGRVEPVVAEGSVRPKVVAEEDAVGATREDL